MQIGVDNDEIVQAFRDGYPKEYSIVVLSIINQKQADYIAALQAQVNELTKEEGDAPKEE